MKACFYCDETAPVSLGVEHTPCDACRSQMKRGIVVVSTCERFGHTMRSGFRVVVGERFFHGKVEPAMIANALRARFTFLHDDAWKLLSLPREKKALWAVALELRNKLVHGGWVPGGIEYAHAHDATEAKFHVVGGYRPGEARVVSVGPVVGYHVNDKDGKALSV